MSIKIKSLINSWDNSQKPPQLKENFTLHTSVKDTLHKFKDIYLTAHEAQCIYRFLRENSIEKKK